MGATIPYHPDTTRHRATPAISHHNVHHALTTKKYLPVFTQRDARAREHPAATRGRPSTALCPKGCDNPFPPEQVRLIRIRANHRHCARPVSFLPSVGLSVRLSVSAISQIAMQCSRDRGRPPDQTGHSSSDGLGRRDYTSLSVTKGVRYCEMISAAASKSPPPVRPPVRPSGLARVATGGEGTETSRAGESTAQRRRVLE